MKSFLNNKFVLEFSILILSFVFIISGIEKIISPDKFGDSIDNYKMVPLFLINIVAIVVPWLELFLGFGILLKAKVKENVFIVSLLLIVFNIMVATALIRGLNIDCGCFGSAYAQKVGVIKLLENFLLLALSINIFVNYENK